MSTMSSTNPQPEEEDEETTSSSGGSSSWGAGFHAKEREIGGGFESAGFRGVPTVKHGGAQYVKPEDTKGSLEHCWCGLVRNHDWPGKSVGAPHPRKEIGMSSTSANPPRVERRALRGYHQDLADLIMAAVNKYGTDYRMAQNSILLFPGDGSPPYRIHCRSKESRIKGAQLWFVRHVVPDDETFDDAKPKPKPVDDEAIKELAEIVNSEEHLPVPEPKVDPPKAEAKPAPKAAAKPKPTPPKAQPEAEAPAPEPVEDDERETPKLDALMASDEWVPYMTGKDPKHQVQHPFYVTNGVDIKCPEHDWIAKRKTRGSLGGHTRTHHTNTDSLWGREAKAKANQTYFTHKAQAQVQNAIEILQDAMDLRPPEVDVTHLTDEVERLKAQVTSLEKKNAHLLDEVRQMPDLKGLNDQYDALLKENGDLKAKLDIIKEGLGL